MPTLHRIGAKVGTQPIRLFLTEHVDLGDLSALFCLFPNQNHMRKCDQCHGEVPQAAKKCMHCGSKLKLHWKDMTKTQKISAIIVGFLLMIAIINLYYDNPESSEANPQTVSTQQQRGSYLFDNPKKLISELSKNGIGVLKPWSNPDDLGWGSLTSYFIFGAEKDGLGIQNNIAYYVEGTKTKAKKIYINLNINNPSDKRAALSFLNEVAEKTFKTLELPLSEELKKSILASKTYQTEIEGFIISNELEQSRIETWKINFERKK